MPNLSPVAVREKYAIYENKLCTGEEAAEHMDRLQNSMRNIGYEIAFERGDWKER
jgi:biotin synthase